MGRFVMGTTRTLSGTLVGVLFASTLGGQAAHATSDADQVAETVSKVAPATAVLLEPSKTDSGLSAQGENTSVIDISETDPAAVISLPEGTSKIAFELVENAGQTLDAEIASDGTVVYRGGGAVDVAMQTTKQSLAVHTVLNNASAPDEFTYSFDQSITLSSAADGSVEVLQEQGDGVAWHLATIETPWAYDAGGKKVQTAYNVDGNELTQELTLTGNEEFPIVADPKLVWTWYGPAVALNKSETRKTRDVVAAAALCGFFPTPFNIACGLQVSSISLWARRAYNQGKCARYIYLPPAFVYGDIYSGGYCT